MEVAVAAFEDLQEWIAGENADRVRQIAGMWTAAQSAFSAERAALQQVRTPLQAGGWTGEAATTFYERQGLAEKSFDAAIDRTGQVGPQLLAIADVIDRVRPEMQALQEEWDRRMASVNNPTVEKVENYSVTRDVAVPRYRITVDGKTHEVSEPPVHDSTSRDMIQPGFDITGKVRQIAAAAGEHVRQDLTDRARRIMSQLERTYMERADALISLELIFEGPRNANVSGLDMGPPPGAGGTGAPVRGRGAGREGRPLPPGAIDPSAGAVSTGPASATGLPPGAIVPDAEVTAAGASAGLPPGAVRTDADAAALEDARPLGANAPVTVARLAAGAIRTDVAVGDAPNGAALDPAALGFGPAAAGLGPAAAGLLRAPTTDLGAETRLPPGAIRLASGVASASPQGGAGPAGALLPRQAGLGAGNPGPQTPPMPLMPTTGRQGESAIPGSAPRTAAPGSTVPPGTPAQLGGRRSGGQRETGQARGAIRGARPAGMVGEDASLPRIAGRGSTAPVAAVRMPDLPGFVVAPAMTQEEPAPQLGRLGPAPAQPGHQSDTSDELGRRARRTAADDVVPGTSTRTDTTLTARAALTAQAARTDRTQRRRRGTRPVPPPERPNEEVWRPRDGSTAKRTDAVVDTPTPPAAEQESGPALGHDRSAPTP